MSFDPSFLSSFVLITTSLSAAFLAALWLSLLIWTYRDIRIRARDPLARILAVLVVAVLFLPGILIYLLVRPTTTIAEEYQHTLEEEALLQSIEDNPLCPGCGRRTREDWIACPNCHTRLKKPCESCHRLLELAWDLCPYCGVSVSTSQTESISEDISVS
jgi:RNA polymerase subunit RPABC4/transcription elongation factor Spt4